MSDILSTIADYKRVDVAQRKARRAVADIEAAIRQVSHPRGFRAALERAHAPGRLALIAEIKKASPSKGLIRADFDPPALARDYEEAGAACLSILTDTPSFQGSDDYLVAARAATGLPCIRKDFMVDTWQVAESRALGSDAILVILAMVDDALASDLMEAARTHGMDALVEVHDEAEMERAARLQADLIGVNNRDLRTFATDLSITERLAAAAPAGALLVTESGIGSAADVVRLERSGAKAMLVGESLMRQADVRAATRALLGAA
jgi:indole-3-glycerol phosphate synthase